MTYDLIKAFLMAQIRVKNAEDTREGVQSRGQEDPQEEEIAIPSSILACEIAWIEEAGGLQTMGLQRV